MKTTAILAEMISIGCLALLWCCPILLAPYDLSEVSLDFSKYKELYALLAVTGFFVLFSVGWLVNGFCYWIAELFGLDRRRSQMETEMRERFHDETITYDDIRSHVYQHAKDPLLTELNTDRTGMRIARTGVFNFLAFSVAILVVGFYPNVWLCLSGLFLWFSIVEHRRRTKRYYNQIKVLYLRTREDSANKGVS